MNDRRNLYRILHAQPDATMEVIRANYRVLMQKLRLHPDLGGEHTAASVLNVAYATLRDPRRRAEYDRELLRRYSIGILGSGGTSGRNRTSRPGAGREADARNYYRRLQVQRDAPAELIAASYRLIQASPDASADQLAEACEVLTDERWRARYDDLLACYGHATAADKLRTERAAGRGPVAACPEGRLATDGNADHADEALPGYEPLILHYCLFCKTPFSPAADAYGRRSCADCASPLARLAGEVEAAEEVTQRALRRVERTAQLTYYVAWPGEACAARLEDLTPVGLRLSTSGSLESRDVIKIDASGFRAVASVMHTRRCGDTLWAGASFLAVDFVSPQGGFVSVSA